MVTTKAEYYIRLLLLNVQVATPALCETFISFVGKTTRKSVDDFLKVFEKGFKSLEKKRIIKKAEFTKLFPSSGKTLIREWDISLLCVVLSHCCTLNGKLYELRDMLLQEAQRNVNNFVQTHRTAINSMKGAEIDDDEYEIVFPIDNSDTEYEKWNMHLIMQILIKLCPAKKTNVMKILRAIFMQEVGLKCSNLDINEFLNCYKDKFLDFNKKSKLSKAQFDTLFPVKGADINTWDDHTLEVVLLNTTSTLSKKSISSLRKIRTIRSDFLAHRGNAEIEFTEFSEKRYELTKAVTKILEDFFLPTLEIKQKINDIVDGPLEIKSSIDCLKAYYTKESLENDNILEALDTVCDAVDSIGFKVDAGFGKMDSRLDAFLKHLDNIERKLPDSAYTEKAEIRCVDMIFVIKSDTVEKKEKAESLIMTAMQKAQQNTTEQIRAAFDVIRKIITEDGKTIVEIKMGSVVVVIKCKSLKGFHRLLKYVYSDQIQTHLAAGASALEDYTGTNTKITVSMSYDSLVNAGEDIVSYLTDYIDHTSHLKMTIERNNVQDLQNLVREFQDGEGAAQLRILSSNLSDYLGESISVDAVTPKISLNDQHQLKGTCDNLYGTKLSTLSQFQLSENQLQLPGTSVNLEETHTPTLSLLELPDIQLQLPGDKLETTGNLNETIIASLSQLDLSASKLQLPGSQDSSVDTPYTDYTGSDLEDFIKKTLNKTPKDRCLLLKLEVDLIKFIRKTEYNYLKFPEMNSYDRMLVHRIAAFFGLDHHVDQTGKCVIVNKTKRTRTPDFSFQEHIGKGVEFKPTISSKRCGGESFDKKQDNNDPMLQSPLSVMMGCNSESSVSLPPPTHMCIPPSPIKPETENYAEINI